MEQHFLQSEAWEKFQESLGHKTIRRNGNGWSYLAIVERSAGFARLYCPYGPTFESLATLDEALASLKEEAAKIGADFLRIQPYGKLLEHNETSGRQLRAIRYSQPVATRIIDVSPSLDEVFLGMSQSNRNVCRNYQKKGMKYHISKNPADIDLLLPCLHDIAVRNHISVHDDDYVRKQAQSMMPEFASLHYIELDGNVVTASLLYEGENTNYYAHSGTRAQHYKLQANTALIGELLNYTKEQGKEYLDLYGIAPNDDKSHRWAGISNFKAKFGGAVVRYNQTYDLPIKIARYWLYNALRVLKN